LEFAKYAYFEGKVVPFAEARISVATHGFLYGTAIFEGIRGFWNETTNDVLVFRLREHLERLAVNARILKMSLPRPVDELVTLVVDLIRKNELRCDLYIRPVLYKSDKRFGVTLFEDQDLTIFFASMGAYLTKTEGIDLAVSSWRRIEDNAIPGRAKINGAYVNSCLAGDEARSNGFDEAVFLNEDGHVSEAPGMNLFLVRGGRLITTPVTANVLEGITRASLMTLAQESFGIEVEERPVDRSELYLADEAFICGTAAKVVSVRSVDRRMVANGKTGPITSGLAEQYRAATLGELEGYRDWITPVYEN
jgi:branched-chain amino acid aminotransferase